MTTPTVRMSNVQVRFGDTEVLRNLTLEVPAGCVFGLLGPNGAGKSTTHAVIAGWLLPDAGFVEVLGHPAGDPELAGKVGAMGQASPLDPDRTLRAELVRHARLLDVADASLFERVGELDLVAFLDRKAGEVSEGQRRRAELACALLGDPPLLLLDEPTAGLDPIQADLVHALLSNRPEGQTVIITSNRLVELDGLCDHIAVIDGGVTVLEEAVGETPIRERFLSVVGR